MRKALALAGVIALAATPALAHPGHEAAGLSAGFLHPFAGLDHMLVMIGVGLWAGMVLGPARLAWPLVFVAFMLVGFTFGAGGAPLPGVEAVIIASVVAIGLAIGLDLKPPAAVGAAAIAVFAAAHGYAHGQEAPAAGAASFAAGFAAATAALHVLGLALASGIRRAGSQRALRTVGFGLAAAGVLLSIA